MLSNKQCDCGCGRFVSIATEHRPSRHHFLGQPQRYIAGHYNKRGDRNSKWRGGTGLRCGYVVMLQPDHPRARGGYVYQHILIAERAIGRPLPSKHPVHHFNEQRTDNRNRNLVICEDTAYHSLLHRRKRAYDATGNPLSLCCAYCKQWETPPNMGTMRSELRKKCNAMFSYHLSCRKVYMQEYHRRTS